jgi:predicted DNA-binding protein
VTRYAAQTKVSSDKSRSEIERTLTRYGASKFMYGWDADAAVIAFSAHERYIRFKLPLPDREDREFTHHSYGRRADTEIERRWEQATRQRWRALALVVKAKLEAVEAGISEFEDEFLAYIVLPDNKTLSEHVRPGIEHAYATGKIQLALPAPSDGNGA